MAADKFTFFISFYMSLKELSPEDFKLVITAMCEKVFFDRDTELDGHVKALYTLIEPILLKTVKTSKERSEQGKKGGAPKGNTNARKQANSSKIKQNQTDKEKEKDKDKEMEKDKDIGEDKDSEHSTSTNNKRFIPPTLEEVQQYCYERGNNINAENFIDYYSSVGWKVGNRAMKDWKAAVRTWEHRKHDFDKGKSNHRFNNCMTNSLSSKELSELEEMLLDN